MSSLQPQRLLCPWNSPGKNTRVGSCSLLQGIFPTQGSNPGLLHCRPILYHLRHLSSTTCRYQARDPVIIAALLCDSALCQGAWWAVKRLTAGFHSLHQGCIFTLLIWCYWNQVCLQASQQTKRRDMGVDSREGVYSQGSQARRISLRSASPEVSGLGYLWDKEAAWIQVLGKVIKVRKNVGYLVFCVGKYGLPWWLSGKEDQCQCRRHRRQGLIPGLGRSHRGGNGNLLSVPAWRIPWTEEPGGLHSSWGRNELDVT